MWIFLFQCIFLSISCLGTHAVSCGSVNLQYMNFKVAMLICIKPDIEKNMEMANGRFLWTVLKVTPLPFIVHWLYLCHISTLNCKGDWEV